MGQASVHANLRHAFRARLITCVAIDHAPGVSVQQASGVFTRASGSWLEAGFAPGMEVTVAGFTGSPLVGLITNVAALALTTDITATNQTVGGGGAFAANLPEQRAWEGHTFAPDKPSRPYIAEGFNPVSSRGLSVGRGPGAVEHIINASVALYYPNENGVAAIESMAGALMTLFERGVALSYGGDSGKIDDVSRSQIYPDGGLIGCAVTARLRSYTYD